MPNNQLHVVTRRYTSLHGDTAIIRPQTCVSLSIYVNIHLSCDCIKVRLIVLTLFTSVCFVVLFIYVCFVVLFIYVCFVVLLTSVCFVVLWTYVCFVVFILYRHLVHVCVSLYCFVVLVLYSCQIRLTWRRFVIKFLLWKLVHSRISKVS